MKQLREERATIQRIIKSFEEDLVKLDIQLNEDIDRFVKTEAIEFILRIADEACLDLDYALDIVIETLEIAREER